MTTKILIDPTKTALVVIDLQQGIVGRETMPHDADSVVTNAASLADACRAKSIPVFLVRVTPSPDAKDALQPVADKPMSTIDRPAGWAEIVPQMGPKQGDFVITKHQWGAFYGTELDLQLRRRGVKTIILCGIATNIGVESTARFGYEYGYNQIFVEDAMSALSAEEHAFTLSSIMPRIGLIRTTSEIVEAIEG